MPIFRLWKLFSRRTATAAGRYALSAGEGNPPRISDRLRRVDLIIDLYAPFSGTERQEVISDIMADIFHYAAAHAISVATVTERALLHWEAEGREAARHVLDAGDR